MVPATLAGTIKLRFTTTLESEQVMKLAQGPVTLEFAGLVRRVGEPIVVVREGSA
jgi:hypothetical protein